MEQYEKNRSFYQKGGITATGGDPLVQIEFVTELFSEAKKRGIHTCLDTSGITFQPENKKRMNLFDQLISVTDLVMLDIKHIDPEGHRKLTGQPLEPILALSLIHIYLHPKSGRKTIFLCFQPFFHFRHSFFRPTDGFRKNYSFCL